MLSVFYQIAYVLYMSPFRNIAANVCDGRYSDIVYSQLTVC